MEALITENAGIAFAMMAILGAAVHWAKKATRGEVTWNPMDYWLADHPGHTGFFAGALVASIWVVVFSDSLTGMQAHMVVASGFTLGWALDSAVNKGNR